MIDKKLIKSRFSTNFKTYNDNAIVQKKVIEQLITLVPLKKYGNILEIGCGTGLLSEKLDRLKAQKLFLNDLCSEPTTIIKPKNIEYEFIIGDAEYINFPKNLDLIISANSIQWFENIDKFFEKSAQALNPGGKLIFSTFVNGNYSEIAKTFGASLKYKTINEITTSAMQYFEPTTATGTSITIYFSTLKELLLHIKNTGVNALNTRILTKSMFAKAEFEYENLRTTKGLPLTYMPAYFVMEKR